MKAMSPDSPPSAESIIRRVYSIYLSLSIISITFLYLNGVSFYDVAFITLSWVWAATYGLFLDFGTRLSVPPRRGRLYRLLFLAPIPIQIGQDVTRVAEYLIIFDNERATHLLLASVDLLLLFVGVKLLRSAYTPRLINPTSTVAPPSIPATNADDAPLPTADSPPPLLGQDNDFIGRVIHAVLSRSAKSERAANFSLTVMLVLVMVGGMASFGLWAFTHADRISTLENEQGKLIKLQNEMRAIQGKLGAGDVELKLRLDSLFKFIEQNYSTSANYEATLNSLKLQSQSNYADIAIRVTIAVLTIFLVQVFFSVYKYNHHHANMLAAKAEALELAGNDADARKELSREAVNIVKESIPSFSPYPRTPIEEALLAAERLKKSG